MKETSPILEDWAPGKQQGPKESWYKIKPTLPRHRHWWMGPICSFGSIQGITLLFLPLFGAKDAVQYLDSWAPTLPFPPAVSHNGGIASLNNSHTEVSEILLWGQGGWCVQVCFAFQMHCFGKTADHTPWPDWFILFYLYKEECSAKWNYKYKIQVSQKSERLF